MVRRARKCAIPDWVMSLFYLFQILSLWRLFDICNLFLNVQMKKQSIREKANGNKIKGNIRKTHTAINYAQVLRWESRKHYNEFKTIRLNQEKQIGSASVEFYPYSDLTKTKEMLTKQGITYYEWKWQNLFFNDI